MRHVKPPIVALAVVVAGACAGFLTASAQPRVEITPFAGYYIASDIYNTYSATGNSNIGVLNSFMWGARLTASVPHGGIEFAYTRTGSDIKINNVQPGQPRDNIGRVDFDNYDINFIGYQRTANPRVTPYGVFGFGWSATHPEIASDFLTNGRQPEGNTLFNFNFGLGFRVAMSEKISTRFEGKWRVTQTNITTSNGYWCDPYGFCYSYASDWYNSGELTAGISYALR